MLNWNILLKYIKGRLSLPSTFIEKADQELKDWVILTSLKEFSDYCPDWERTGVVINSTTYIHPTKSNWYYFFDEEDLEIIGIKQCYFPSADQWITGHPIMPPMSFEGMKGWSVEVFKSRFFYPFSMWNYTYKYIPPNIIELPVDVKPENFVVEYERVHPEDLRKIPTALHRTFMDLALADCMIWLGGMRSMYGDGRLQTPFGEIPLNGSELKQEGQELKRETMEKITTNSMPPIVIDIG